MLETLHDAYPERFPLSQTLANFADGRGNFTVSVNYLMRNSITRGERGDFAFESLSDGCIVPGSGGSGAQPT